MPNPPFPLYYVIYQYIKTKKEASFKDIMQALGAFGYTNVNESDVLKSLMRLELDGLIIVNSDRKYRYYVRLRQ